MTYPTIPPTRTLRELPPRKLGPLNWAALFFGDRASQIGWALLAIGSVFFWTTSMRSEARIFLDENIADWKEKAGVVLEADSTEKVEKGNRIWRFYHSFALDGQRYLGESYAVGKKFDEGQIAYIRYDATDPGTNYIIGMRRSLYDAKVNYALLVPLFSLLFIFAPMRRNLKFIRVLQIGDFGRGRLIDKIATNKSVRDGVNERPVFKYVFQFEHEGVIYHANCTTHRTDQVEDEAMEIILFDRFKPYYNIVYDAVPNAPAINAAGRMEPAPAWKSWVLFLPGFCVAVNLVFAILS